MAGGARPRTDGRLEVIPAIGMPEVRPGDDLTALLLAALHGQHEAVLARDVVVLAQKVVSKSEGRLVRLADVVPGERALRMAGESGKDARALEVVLSESRAVLRWERGVLIAETRHGFVCANAGVDQSNAGAPGVLVLLPLDPDASAARLREEIRVATGVEVAVVITDTFGRAWREGHVNVAIGAAGLPALERLAGRMDPEGYELKVTQIALADEIASATELVMGKLDRRPAAVVRGLVLAPSDETARTYVRPRDKDMFR